MNRQNFGIAVGNVAQSLEDKIVAISHSAGSLTYPANFTLAANINPTHATIIAIPRKNVLLYHDGQSLPEKISGPVMGRIDIHVEVPRVPFEKLSSQHTGEPSAKVRERIEAARTIQRERFKGTTLQTNADMGPAEIRKFCPVDETSANLLKAAMNQMQLSARAYHRILKLARTIADLAGSTEMLTAHIAEAIQYRPRLRV